MNDRILVLNPPVIRGRSVGKQLGGKLSEH